MLDSAVSVGSRRIWGDEASVGRISSPAKTRPTPARSRASGGGFLASPPRERRAEVSSPALPRERRAEASSPALPRERRAEASSPASPGERRAEFLATAPLVLGYTRTLHFLEFLQVCSFTYENQKLGCAPKSKISLVITINKFICDGNHEMISWSLRSCWWGRLFCF